MLAAFEPNLAAADTIILDPKTFAPSLPDYRFDTVDSARFLKPPQTSPLDRIDLDGRQLRFDTSRTPAIVVPGTNDDGPELAEVIAPPHRVKKHAQRLRQYFGLTFSTPTD